MRRAEKFALIVAVVGLIADVLAVVASGLAIASAANGLPEQIGQEVQHLPLSSLLQSLAIVILTYSWFVISWFLTRRYFLVWINDYEANSRSHVGERNELVRFGQRTGLIVFGIGVMLVPVAFMIEPSIILGALFVSPLLWGVEAALMPVIYPAEMDIDGLFTTWL